MIPGPVGASGARGAEGIPAAGRAPGRVFPAAPAGGGGTWDGGTAPPPHPAAAPPSAASANRRARCSRPLGRARRSGMTSGGGAEPRAGAGRGECGIGRCPGLPAPLRLGRAGPAAPAQAGSPGSGHPPFSSLPGRWRLGPAAGGLRPGRRGPGASALPLPGALGRGQGRAGEGALTASRSVPSPDRTGQGRVEPGAVLPWPGAEPAPGRATGPALGPLPGKDGGKTL